MAILDNKSSPHCWLIGSALISGMIFVFNSDLREPGIVNLLILIFSIIIIFATLPKGLEEKKENSLEELFMITLVVCIWLVVYFVFFFVGAFIGNFFY